MGFRDFAPRESAGPEGVRGAVDRLSAAARREAILDVAFELLRDEGPEAVTMGAVADRTCVTRTLIYKHFANRGDLLAAVFRRETERLDRQAKAEVSEAAGFEARLRRFVRAVFRAVDSHGWLFVPLQAYSLAPGLHQEQRAWDRRTIDAFAELASREMAIAPADATAALSVLLSGIGPLRVQASTPAGAEERARLEDLYVTLVRGALQRLAQGAES